MWEDFALASLHHLLVFGLMAMLAAESVLLSRPLDPAAIRRLFKVDSGYGMAAGLLLAAGLWRVFGGTRGADFYLHNPWFHAKLALLPGGDRVVVADAVVPAVAQGVARRCRLRSTPCEAARLRAAVRLELGLVTLIFVLAAGMARYGGLSF